ncbi:MAG: hypothetical protein OHK0011_26230 [Turneriella sp.]
MNQKISKTAGDIAAECAQGYKLRGLVSGGSISIKKIAGTEECAPGDLLFVSDATLLAETLARKLVAMVIQVKVAEK